PVRSAKSQRLVDIARQGAPLPVSGRISAQGETDFDTETNEMSFRIFNAEADDFGRRALKWSATNFNARGVVDALRGEELYGFGMQIPVIHYGTALQMLGQMNGWCLVAFEPRPELRFPISSYSSRNAYREGLLAQLTTNGIALEHLAGHTYVALPRSNH